MHAYTDNHRAYVISKQTFQPQCLYNRHSTPADYDNRDCVLHPQNSANCSAWNPLIVRAESARMSTEKLSFPCHVPYVSLLPFITQDNAGGMKSSERTY